MLYENECAAAGLDIEKLKPLLARLSRAAKEAEKMGLTIFGGSGAGTLRFNDGHNRPLIVAAIDGRFDGGDGACWLDAHGLMRGE